MPDNLVRGAKIAFNQEMATVESLTPYNVTLTMSDGSRLETTRDQVARQQHAVKTPWERFQDVVSEQVMDLEGVEMISAAAEQLINEINEEREREFAPQ